MMSVGAIKDRFGSVRIVVKSIVITVVIAAAADTDGGGGCAVLCCAVVGQRFAAVILMCARRLTDQLIDSELRDTGPLLLLHTAANGSLSVQSV